MLSMPPVVIRVAIMPMTRQSLSRFICLPIPIHSALIQCQRLRSTRATAIPKTRQIAQKNDRVRATPNQTNAAEQLTKMLNLTGNSKSSSDESFEAIPTDTIDLMLTDINEQGLKNLGDLTGIENLSDGEFSTPAFPLKGIIFDQNNRLMINLVCRRAEKPRRTIRVWFLVDTGSNPSFLSMKTIDALIGSDNPLPKSIAINMQDPNIVIHCQLSSLDKHFPEANILGMQAMLNLGVSIEGMNRDQLTFELVKQQL